MSKHRVIYSLRLFIVNLLLVIAFSSGTAQLLPSFRIGILDHEDGPIALGAGTAISVINAAGGVQGADSTVFQLEAVVIPPDADGNIETAINNLAQANVIAVLGPVDTDAALNNLGALQRLGIPVLTPAVGDTIIASDATGEIFRSRAAEFLQGRALATYLAEDLRLGNVITVQLDIASTAAIIGFSSAASGLGIAPQQNLLFGDGRTLADLANEVVRAVPQVVVAYGPADLTAALYIQLKQAGWSGVFATPQAENQAFRDLIPASELVGMLGTTTWSPASSDAASQIFVLDYVRLTGKAPGPVAAAAYDSVFLIAQALGLPGSLERNLMGLEDAEGVQGILRPAALTPGELSDNVAVIRLGSLGGPDIVARFAGTTRLGQVETTPPVVDGGTLEPTITATLDGVYVKIVSNVQNVRTGPGTEYEVLGQVQKDELHRVLGANIDFSWVVIEFRGQQGWLSTASNLLEVLGNRATVPVVASPPTPTPNPATGTPPSSPNSPDIVITAASPAELPYNSSTNVSITMRNAGGVNAGPFAVAASFPPNNFYSALNFPSLAAGVEQTFLLPVTTDTQTGNFQAIIVADLNQQVAEGPAGEANNSAFLYNYRVDRPSLTNASNLTTGSAIDLDFNGIADINYNAAGLNTNGGCNGTIYCIGLLSPGLTWTTAHYDAISFVNGIGSNSILNASLTPGTTLGVLTDTGKRAVIRIDSINPGVNLTITYRTY